MASANKRRTVGIGLLGSGVVGEAIQDILFHDLKGQVGSADGVELEIRKDLHAQSQRQKMVRQKQGAVHQPGRRGARSIPASIS